jgi:hypothetical protein
MAAHLSCIKSLQLQEEPNANFRHHRCERTFVSQPEFLDTSGEQALNIANLLIGTPANPAVLQGRKFRFDLYRPQLRARQTRKSQASFYLFSQ